jgi:non-specific serine/threonine protein kinase
MDAALEASGEDYNAYVPIVNSLGALEKGSATKRGAAAHCGAGKSFAAGAEDPRARILLGENYAELGRVEDSLRETNLAITLRANEASILYNAACTYCQLKYRDKAIEALQKAWEADSRTPPGRDGIRICRSFTGSRSLKKAVSGKT